MRAKEGHGKAVGPRGPWRWTGRAEREGVVRQLTIMEEAAGDVESRQQQEAGRDDRRDKEGSRTQEGGDVTNRKRPFGGGTQSTFKSYLKIA